MATNPASPGSRRCFLKATLAAGTVGTFHQTPGAHAAEQARKPVLDEYDPQNIKFTERTLFAKSGTAQEAAVA